MNRRALHFALAYSAFFILFKLSIILGGFALTRFGFYFSNITAFFCVVPFYILAVKGVRDKEQGGTISGREAMRITLTVFAVSAIIISIYHYIEFEMVGKQLAAEYYRSQQFLDFLKLQVKVKPEDYEKVIQQQIAGSDTAAFQATTGKLFSFMIIGLGAAFITSALMKRRVIQR